jgi:hypothetical protein
VLLLGELPAGHRRVAVGVGDRLALDADLLALHRNCRGHVLGDDVLAQPGPARLALGRADRKLLLRTRHRVVGLGTADVTPDGLLVAIRVRAALRQPGVRARLAVGDAVVGVQRRLVLLGELAVGLHLRRVLDLLLAVGRDDVVPVVLGVLERHERGLAAEHAGVDQRPLRPVGLGIEVDLLDLAELVAVGVDRGAAAPLDHFGCTRHAVPSSSVWRLGRWSAALRGPGAVGQDERGRAAGPGRLGWQAAPTAVPSVG